MYNLKYISDEINSFFDISVSFPRCKQAIRLCNRRIASSKKAVTDVKEE